MKRTHFSAAILGVCASIFGCSGEAPGELENLGEVTLAASASDPFVFATFDGDGATEQRLFIYTSTDGSNWSELSNTGFTGPTGTLRDPSIIKNPNDGAWYIAYTVYSWSQNSYHFNVAKSTNLTNWTHVASVSHGVTGTNYVWAPEFYVEGTAIKVIVSLSPGNAPWAFKSYYYSALNSGLTSWSGPTQMSGLGPNKIDTYVVKKDNVYHAFTQNGDTLYQEHATASSLNGPWTYVQTGNWHGWGSGKEGGSLFQNNDGSYTWFMDWYPNNGIYKATSWDLTNWTGISSVGSLSSKRHGSVWRQSAGGGGAITGLHKINPSFATGQCVEPAYDATPGRFMQHWACWQSAQPNWNIVEVSSGVYELKTANNGLCLTVWTNNYTNGNNLGLWQCQGQAGSRWSVTPQGSNYQFRSINNTNKCIDVSAGGTANGTRLQIWDCSSVGTNQSFRVAAP